MTGTRDDQANSASPAAGRGVLKLASAASLVALLGISACSDDPYERSVEAPEDEHDPTEVEAIQPPGQTSPPRPEQREPLQVTEDEVIDPPAPPNPGGEPEDADKAPLDPPTQAQQIDPTGEPIEDALPGDPTRSMDATESYAIDPVGEPLVDGDEADGGDAERQDR